VNVDQEDEGLVKLDTFRGAGWKTSKGQHCKLCSVCKKKCNAVCHCGAATCGVSSSARKVQKSLASAFSGKHDLWEGKG
jgi:hypothetical protein